MSAARKGPASVGAAIKAVRDWEIRVITADTPAMVMSGVFSQIERQEIRFSGHTSSNRSSSGSGVTVGLESSASTNSRAHAGYQIRREGFLTYLRYASRLKRAKKVVSGVFLSAIQATVSTVIGGKRKSRPAPAATQGCLNKAYSKS